MDPNRRRRVFQRERARGAGAQLVLFDLPAWVDQAKPVQWFHTRWDAPKAREQDHALRCEQQNQPGAERMSRWLGPDATQQTARPGAQELRMRPAMPAAFANPSS